MAHPPQGAQDGALYNEDLAPIPADKRQWGAFEIFNVWNNDIQSLFGYSLAASLFITYGLNGWAVFAAIVWTALGLSMARPATYGRAPRLASCWKARSRSQTTSVSPGSSIATIAS